MANDLNLCQFIGRLGRDPETRYMPNGDAVTNFSIACGWKGKSAEGTEWVRITTFAKLAEICGEYLKKGAQVYISGRIQTRKWQDKEGNDRYSTEIVADRMQMLGGKREAKDDERDPGEAPAGSVREQTRKGGGNFDEMDDDIPF